MDAGNTPELSVIVPVYKAEDYLDRCAESILSQKVRNLELILVEDGSPDRSGVLCDQWAAKDSRIQVIHQANAGVSAARNRGLEKASGTYVGFVDSDDWILPQMYQLLLESSRETGADVVMCDTRSVYSDGREAPDTIPQLPESCLLSHEDLTAELLPDFAGSACRCIYRRSLLQEHNIRFPTGLKFSEDRVFNICAMGFARKISYLPSALYMRFVNMESCVNTFHPDYALQGKRAWEETGGALKAAWDNDPRYYKAYLRQYANVFFNVLDLVRQHRTGLSAWNNFREVRKVCADSMLRDYLRESGYGGRQGKMILSRRYLGLLLLDGRLDRKIQNFRELWEEAGIRGVIRKCAEKLRR